MEFFPLEDGNARASLRAPTRLAYGQSKPFTIGFFFTRSPSSAEGFPPLGVSPPLMGFSPLSLTKVCRSVDRISLLRDDYESTTLQWFPRLAGQKFVATADEISLTRKQQHKIFKTLSTQLTIIEIDQHSEEIWSYKFQKLMVKIKHARSKH